MKVALCSTIVPFIRGGDRNIVEWLETMLLEAGHSVERVYLPMVDTPELLFRQMAAFRFVDLSMADRIICFRPQSHLIQHPHKILWFIHHIRVLYDLWQNPDYCPYPDDFHYEGVRAALRSADNAALHEAEKIILPGVGAFADAMAKLEATGLVPVIRAEAEKKPLLVRYLLWII